MTRFNAIALTSTALFVAASSSYAAPITLLPDDINGGDTNTAQFSNADVTITPFVGGVQATFNDGSARLGTDDPAGTNVNAFNDQDTIAGNGDDESLTLAFEANAGLTQLAWDFSRADGGDPLSGVRINGFTADPGASLSGFGVGTNSVSYNAGTGELRLNLPGATFSGNDSFLDLSNAAASAGQTLTITVNDTDQAGAQFAILSISYENAVPEPGSLALLGLGGLLIARRRRA